MPVAVAALAALTVVVIVEREENEASNAVKAWAGWEVKRGGSMALSPAVRSGRASMGICVFVCECVWRGVGVCVVRGLLCVGR
jgi:hypothetical protein